MLFRSGNTGQPVAAGVVGINQPVNLLAVHPSYQTLYIAIQIVPGYAFLKTVLIGGVTGSFSVYGGLKPVQRIVFKSIGLLDAWGALLNLQGCATVSN